MRLLKTYPPATLARMLGNLAKTAVEPSQIANTLASGGVMNVIRTFNEAFRVPIAF